MRTRRSRRLSVAFAVSALAIALIPSAAAGAPSCAGQFVPAAAQIAWPLGLNVVVPEVRLLSLGGPNLGQEVKAFFATADRTDCPITAAP
jgi:hypothetical protein